jgi:hypothetical protein
METSLQPGFDSTNFSTLWGCATLGLKPVHSKLSIGNFQESGKFTKKTYLTPQIKDMKPIQTNAARLTNKTVKPDASEKYDFFTSRNLVLKNVLDS